MPQVGTGIIGAGRIGRLHAEHLALRTPDADLIAIADVRLEAAEECAVDLKIPSAVRDHHELLENPDIEAVVICSSTDTHAQIIKEAAAAGKHIFCEKPIGFDLAKIDRALEAVGKAGVKLQIGFNRRFDPSFKRARDLVAAGEIGEPHIVHIISRDPEPPPIDYIETSGGIFLDMTIHDFDMARYLIDEEVTEVYAIGGVMVDPRIGDAGDIDTAIITLRYRSGAIGVIDNSRKAVYGYDQRVEVFGSGGRVVVSNSKPDTAAYSNAQGVHSSPPLFFFMERYEDAYIAEMRGFIECIQQDKTPPVTGIDGRAAVVMGYAAESSYEENRPVKLSEIDQAL
ncbi:MAG: inositol 2-dehydrogenase [Chloroflexota bacterium]|nr:inositol 2-dehydrogenase [Chloroflexota bacterium]